MMKNIFSKTVGGAQAAPRPARADAHRSISGETPLIELRDIYKIYHMGDMDVRASDGITLKICRGEFVSIVGKSGSGKSTIMNIIGALDVPTSGQYILNGQDVSTMKDDQLADVRNKTIGFIFQQYNLLPKQNLLENVELPLIYAGVGKKEREERALKSLEKVGLGDKWRYFPLQLSGGQQQRAAIGRALMTRPSLILADEPTGNLDTQNSSEVMALLKETSRKYEQTIIMITHNRRIAQTADRILQVSDGVVTDFGRAGDVRRLSANDRQTGYGKEGGFE